MRWWPSVTGCAVCRWVKPGMMLAACSSARATSAFCSAPSPASAWSIASRTHSLKSVATWSLRLRAVCSRPAAGPISSARRLSVVMWMSSSAQSSGTPSLSYSAATRSSPRSIATASSDEITPQAPSIAACALLAAMSCRQSALSNGIEALISRMIALGPSAKRPPHIRLEPDMPRLFLVSLTCALALAVAGCDRESEQAAQPQAAAELTGTIDRTSAGEAMPAVELTDPSGATLATADLKGTPVLLNLWATWCVPCVTEMPLLDRLAADLGKDVRVLTVSQDMTGAEAVEPFFAERNLGNLPQWLDPENTLGVLAQESGLPLTVLYDAEGKEVWRVAGGYDWAGAEARAAIAEATT